MNKVRINLWNREFELVVSFSCYPGECITDIQKDAIMDFCKHTTGLEDALDELKNYIEKCFTIIYNTIVKTKEDWRENGERNYCVNGCK